MNCPKCGTELPAGESVCGKCGFSTSVAAQTNGAPMSTQLPPTSPAYPSGQVIAAAAAPRYYPVKRMTGVIIFAVGCLLLVANIAFRVPPGKGFAILTMFVGAVLFGLSFVPWFPAESSAPDELQPADRVTRVFYEPEPVFKNLKFYPRWLTAFLIIALLSGIYTIASSQRLGPVKMASELTERVIANGWVPEAEVAKVRADAVADAANEGGITDIIAPLSGIEFVLLFMLALAGLYMLGVMAFGGRMNFWQALCVAVYSSLPVVVIVMILNLVLLFVKPVEDLEAFRVQKGLARADLGLLFSAATPDEPLLLEHPYLYTIGSLIGIFSLYGWWLSSTGLRYAGEKLSKGSAWSIVFIIWFLGLLLSLVGALIAPAFLG